MSVNIKWARKHGVRKATFSTLSKPFQLALFYYMCVDGEAWPKAGEPLNEYFDGCMGITGVSPASFVVGLERFLPLAVKHYGKTPFGVLEIPTAEVKAAVMKRGEDLSKFDTFEAYHLWYIENNHYMPNHSSRNPWPCILSSRDDEVFEDGWHRFHRYCELGMKSIPCVVYL